MDSFEVRHRRKMELWKLRVFQPRKRAGANPVSTPLPGRARPARISPPRPGAAPPAAHSLKGKLKVKALPKVKENAELTQLDETPSTSQSVQLNITEKMTMEENIEDAKNKVLQKESKMDSSESKESLRSSPTTTGMTTTIDTPSFLNFSDSDFSEDSEDNLSSFPSPEVFREADCIDFDDSNAQNCLKYKNSTLLDTSTAVAIEEVQQFSNLSAIRATISEDCEEQPSKKKGSSNDEKIAPRSKNILTPETGKKDCKISPAEEKTPDTKSRVCSSAPARPKKKPRTHSEPRNTHFKTRINFSHDLKTKTPCNQRSATQVTPSTSAEMLPANHLESKMKNKRLRSSTPCSKAGDLVLNLSPVKKSSLEEELLPNVSCFINSDEIVPASLNSEVGPPYQIPPNAPEICCILRASPGTRMGKIKYVTKKKSHLKKRA
ncbi:meiosis-specific kinetochore protein isoform X2 [Tachyglossus aculeatus]|uniref:meiosis-specific kinetochore protein isoform X2 n=1 Tax=Tachyglossus aculeatus TaxID=9261 RepID=UPI0018F31122|nr:meiosis-specific kinetochore protein isoform X2 [Tachyglossus aculeatus]